MMELPEAHRIGPDFLIGLFEQEVAAQHVLSRPAGPLAGPRGVDAIRPQYMPRLLADSLAQQGYDPEVYCRNLRQSLQEASQ